MRQFKMGEMVFNVVGQEDSSKGVFHDKARNNLIVVNTYTDGFDEPDTIQDVFYNTMPEPMQKAFSYLMTNTDTIIFWTKMSGATSDFLILPDMDVEAFMNIPDVDTIEEILTDDLAENHFKYAIVLGDECYQI